VVNNYTKWKHKYKIVRKPRQEQQKIKTQSSSSFGFGWRYFRHSLMSIWLYSTRSPIRLTSRWRADMEVISCAKAASMSKEVGTACEDDNVAAVGRSGGGWGTAPWASCLIWALDFMRVCMPRGSRICERGSESKIYVMTWKQIWVIKHPKDRLVFFSSHSVQDVLAQAKRSPHHDGIKKGGLLESKLTPPSLRPKVCDNNLC
jgi:hypothetical protein